MVLLHVKKGEESLFLHSCCLEDSVSEVNRSPHHVIDYIIDHIPGPS